MISRTLFCGVLLLWAISSTSAKADPQSPIILDANSGTVFGATLGMREEEVKDTLKKAGFSDVKRVDYPGRHFLLQSSKLVKEAGGAIVFFFDDRKTLTRIYSNAENLKIGATTKLSVGMPLDAFANAFGAVKDIELLPNKRNRGTYFEVGHFRICAISDLVSDQVLAWSIRVKQSEVKDSRGTKQMGRTPPTPGTGTTEKAESEKFSENAVSADVKPGEAQKDQHPKFALSQHKNEISRHRIWTSKEGTPLEGVYLRFDADSDEAIFNFIVNSKLIKKAVRVSDLSSRDQIIIKEFIAQDKQNEEKNKLIEVDPGSASEQYLRTWRSVDGRTLVGTFRGVSLSEDGNLKEIAVFTQDSQLRRIPIDQLLPEDRDYVASVTWNNTNGTVTIGSLAKVMKSANGEVVGAAVRLPDGNVSKLPLHELGPDDQAYVRRMAPIDLEWGIPRKHSLEQEFERLGLFIKDQGRRGSCTVFASLAVIEYHLARKGKYVQLSEQFAAWAATEVGGTRKRSGYSAWDVTQGAKEYGITTEALMPYSTRRVGRPSKEALADAANRKNVATVVFEEDPERDGISLDVIRAMCGSISEGWPVTMSVGWDDGDLDEGNMLSERGVYSGNGHAIVLVGYTRSDSFSGGGKFVFRNSWGTDYGRNGYADISFQYLMEFGGKAFAIRLF